MLWSDLALSRSFYRVSTLHPHKNLDNLLAAFARFREERPDFRLVMTGVRGFHTAAVESRIRELRLEDSVTLTGWIERSELYDLFRRATAMIYPTMFEGFGLPVIEAMAAGLPLACSNIEPLHSTVAGAAIEFPPQDVDAMVRAMRRLTADTRELVERGRATGHLLHVGRDGPENDRGYRSRSSSWIFASVLASRYLTITGV